jgi:ubiquinone/menaquinone biosynthesis C-methylase UbiE
MKSQTCLTTEERIVQLLRHLGVKRAHFAASMPRDWAGLTTSYPDVVSSLSLVAPWGFKLGALRSHASRLLVISGDQGRPAEEVRHAMQSLPGATLMTLHDYFSSNWADIIADRTDAVGTTMMNFIARMEESEREAAVTLDAQGEFAELSYSVCGSGTPLVLLPLALAPSQWQPLIPALSKRHCTIVLAGPLLGAAAFLEARAAGYLRVVRSLIDETRLLPGETVLEVGCGSGVILRWLAQYTRGANRLVGIDVNRYLLREGLTLAKKADIQDVIALGEGNAESLPFSDSCFDVTIACTVMEEGDADRMLAECVRVTRPQGRVAIVVRSIDMPGWVNLPLGAALKRKAEAQSGNAQELGCADASLYQRMHKAGLDRLVMFPQWATYTDGERLDYMEERILASLTLEEAKEWQQARSRPDNQGTFFIAQPFHCALGTKR